MTVQIISLFALVNAAYTLCTNLVMSSVVTSDDLHYMVKEQKAHMQQAYQRNKRVKHSKGEPYKRERTKHFDY